MKKTIKKVAATTLSVLGILSAMPSAFCVPPKMDSISDELVFLISKENIERVEDPCKLEIIRKKYKDIIAQYNLDPSEIYTNCLVAIPNMGFYRVGDLKEGGKSIEKTIFLPGSFDEHGFWKVLKENGVINENNEYSAQWKPLVLKDTVNNNYRIVFRSNGNDEIIFLFDKSNIAFHARIRNREPEMVVNPSLRDFLVPEFSAVGRPRYKTINIHNTVTDIANFVFSDCNNIGEVNIPDSVSSIGEGSFMNCENLRRVYIPDSVTTIGKRAFENCGSLEEIIIPNLVTSIKERTFFWCASLKKVDLSPNITDIEKHAFESCCSLEEIFIPDGVISIGEGAFCDCQSLWRAYIPCTVKNIARDAFKGCANLSSIIFDGIEYGSVDSFMEAFEDYQESHIA